MEFGVDAPLITKNSNKCFLLSLLGFLLEEIKYMFFCMEFGVDAMKGTPDDWCCRTQIG